MHAAQRVPSAQLVAHEERALALEQQRTVSVSVAGRVHDTRCAGNVEHVAVAECFSIVNWRRLGAASARHVAHKAPESGPPQQRYELDRGAVATFRARLADPRLILRVN